MPFISQSSIQELHDRLDAAAVVSDYVRLEKKGGRLWACCPFHQEKTASFTVNPDLKSYYCFGCHKGGSVINFVMEMDSLSFPEAVETLAKRFGLELSYEDSDRRNTSEDDAKKKARDDLFELYHRITGTFRHFLEKETEGEAAKKYILSRGISEEMLKHFRLGYAPADRTWLYNFLLKKGYSKVFLAASGLFSSRYEGVSLFSGRLMFPISDRQGRTIAFGGRALSEGPNTPKYINSPELGIYKKREALYGLDLALPEIKRSKKVYVAEGYLDVMALHQAGITNAVAPLGTALTDEQIMLMKRWAEDIILFFDDDEAGHKAALAAILASRRNGLTCSIVSSNDPSGASDPSGSLAPDGAKDPAEILKKFGAEALQSKAKSIIFDFSYLLDRARIIYDSGSGGPGSEGKVRALIFLFPYIDLLDSDVVRNSCIDAAADHFGLLPGAVSEEYRRYRRNDGAANRSLDRRVGVTPKEDNDRQSHRTGSNRIRVNDELSLLLTVAVDYISNSKDKLFPKFRAALDISEIEDPNAREIFIALEECIRYDEISMDDLLQRLSSPELKTFFIEHSSTGEFSGDSNRLMKDGIRKIKGRHLKKQQQEIIIKLRTIKKNQNTRGAEEESDESVLSRDLLAEKMRIDSELSILEQGKY